MFFECACDMRPHLLEVLLTVLREQGGKGALLGEGVQHVSLLELFYLPVVDSLVIPSCARHRISNIIFVRKGLLIHVHKTKPLI